ncbi:MAG: DUF624 domain-containing protein [Eubacteriales bacterium]|nr:DUF624 domain-containing protein [Eubacteriales bacterium]
MVNFIDNDSPLGRFVQRLLELIGLNLVWVLCCLPVVTAGAATTALHFGLRPQPDAEEGALSRFFRSFRREFKTATALWLVLLVAAVFLLICFRIVSFWGGWLRTAGIMFFCVPALLWLMTAAYAFPLLARFEIPAWKLAENALLLALAHFPRTLAVIALNLMPLVLVWLLPSRVLSILFILVPVGFSGTALLIDRCLRPVFQPLS